MIVDLFQFADEVDIAEIRIASLYDIVDQFCIVESGYDQMTNPKPYNFELNKDRYAKWADKITYLKLEEYAPRKHDFDWSNEIFVRESLMKAIDKYQEDKKITLKDDDYLIFADTDETINPEALKLALEKSPEILSFNHLFISYKLDYYCPGRNWFGGILAKNSVIKHYGFQYLRSQKDHMTHFEDERYPSWHFSGVGENSFEVNWNKWITRVEPKIKKQIIPEFKEQYRKYFNETVFDLGFFFYSDNIMKHDIKLEKLDNSKLPLYVQQNPDKFKNLLLSQENKDLGENI